MDLTFKRKANDYLLKLVDTLDITDTQYGIAENRYQALGDWLTRDGSSLRLYNPTVHPQGSILLGTVVKPFGAEDEFDVDLVCEILMDKTTVSQRKLKQAVGKEVKDYATTNNFKKACKEGKRCWTLEYADDAKFHMDVLPAIPDKDKLRLMLEARDYDVPDQTDKAIAITDNTYPSYSMVSQDWPISNPKGYHEWFKSRMLVRFTAKRDLLAESMKANVEDVPDYKVKTPLQQCVQLLKRHRDMMFQKDMDNKPISIIITTLAAHAYNNEDNIVDALLSITQNMHRFIEDIAGISWVKNPVNPLENFADKWPDNPKLKENFKAWLTRIRVDFAYALQSADLAGLADRLGKPMGSDLASKTLNEVEGPSLKDMLKTALGSVAMQPWNLPKYIFPHRQVPPWDEKLLGEVTVTGKIKTGQTWKSFDSDTKGLPKHRELEFTATTKDIVPPYSIYWQTVNTGYEAAKKPDLRGGIVKGSGPFGEVLSRERTLYRGMHWVEAFVVRDNVILARSGPFEVNIG
ncbi:nucleotidyltransferase [uncultured Pseudodesulfovibrio sp.]|uniref:nucleotidyltransferase n=1 Tax=uncultured Pseudodesulfovibrio sp. TaxID=2035858 RepID=UPI0029C72428|nr:nucleotidyltransferase [uncultured Pseudodesulfovibrio sp.]